MLYFRKSEMYQFNETPLSIICVAIGTTAKSPLNLVVSGSDGQIADACLTETSRPFRKCHETVI